MDGNTLRTGAIGALKGFESSVSVAYRVMTDLNHEILVGEGAALFAKEIGAIPKENLIEDSKQVWSAKLAQNMTAEEQARFPHVPLARLSNHATDPECVRDTTIFLSADHQSKLSVATSTLGGLGNTLGDCGT